MKHRVWFLSFACIAALAACQSTAGVPPPLAANAVRSERSSTTQAWGYVYSDPEGIPLAGVPVEIAAWLPINGKLQPSRQVAKTNAAGHFEFTAANGKYLLTIGSDEAYTPPPGYQTPGPESSATDPGLPGMHWLATVHDAIELTGGSQKVKTSTLPRQTYPGKPGRPYKYVPLPAIERTNDYRLTQLSSMEAECLVVQQYRRHWHHRKPLVPDEWLTENMRAILRGEVLSKSLVRTWATIGAPPGDFADAEAATTSCAIDLERDPPSSQELDRRTLWVGITGGVHPVGRKSWLFYEVAEWFVDPRLTTQVWPWAGTSL